MTNAVIRGSQRREQILATAMELFGEVGYRGTSLRDIANRVGITHPGLLYHFHSKEELLMAVLEHRDQVDSAHFQLLADVDPRARVRGLVANIAANVAVPGLIELFATLSGEATNPRHPAHAYFNKRYQTFHHVIRRVGHDLDQAGHTVRSFDNDNCAHSLVALMDGIQIQWLFAPHDVDMVAILVEYFNDYLKEPLDPKGDWGNPEYLAAQNAKDYENTTSPSVTPEVVDELA